MENEGILAALSETWDEFAVRESGIPDWLEEFRRNGAFPARELGVSSGGVGRGEPLVTFQQGDIVFGRFEDHEEAQQARLEFYSLDQGPMFVSFGPPHNRRKIRFSVGTTGQRSTTWTLFGNKKNDVYLASRKTGGCAKFSLHQSGDWRLQWTGDDRESWKYRDLTGQEPPDGRVMMRWAAPEMVNEWTKGLSLLVPAEDVSYIPLDDEVWADTAWMPAPNLGWMVAFELWMVRPHADPMTLFPLSQRVPEGGLMALIGGMRLPRGESVLLWGFAEPLSLGQRVQLDHMRKVGDPKVKSHFGERILIHSEDESGRKELWDLSAETFDPWQAPSLATFRRSRNGGR